MVNVRYGSLLAHVTEIVLGSKANQACKCCFLRVRLQRPCAYAAYVTASQVIHTFPAVAKSGRQAAGLLELRHVKASCQRVQGRHIAAESTRQRRELRCLTRLHNISWLLRTILATFFLKPSLSSRHCLAASMLAGDSSLGEDSMEMMEIIMLST